MRLPGEQDLLDERAAVLVTLASLTDDEFESGPTLCSDWSPRDVLAHLMGIDGGLGEYVRAKGNIARANAEIVERARARSRAELMAAAEPWATRLPITTRSAAVFLLGDTAIHHQDVLRGTGRSREVPAASRAAILREGAVLGPQARERQLHLPGVRQELPERCRLLGLERLTDALRGLTHLRGSVRGEAHGDGAGQQREREQDPWARHEGRVGRGARRVKPWRRWRRAPRATRAPGCGAR